MIKKFALFLGIIYVPAGISGFIPGLTAHQADVPPSASIRFTAGFFVLVPVNILLNIVHLAIGFWGIFASRSASVTLLGEKNAVV